MKASDVLMVASGTATLEAAVVGTPMVSLYVMHWLNYLIMKKLVISEHVTLVNIQADKAVIREFIQNAATPAALSAEVNRLLDDESYREKMVSNLLRIRNELQTPPAEIAKSDESEKYTSEHVAALAYNLLQHVDV